MPVTRKPTCVFCGEVLRRYRYRNEPWARGRQWGSHGDGLFCGKTCGYKYAVRQLVGVAQRRAEEFAQ